MPTRHIALAFAFSCAAFQAHGQDLFERLDQDRDGVLSSQELQSDAASRGDWIAVDRDRDGRITRDEFGTVPVARSGGRQGAAGATQPSEKDKPGTSGSATGSGRP